MEIARERSISHKTILTHIFFWFNKGEWDETDKYISQANIKIISDAIEAIGDYVKLKPIFEYLGEKIDYDTIRWGVEIWCKRNGIVREEKN